MTFYLISLFLLIDTVHMKSVGFYICYIYTIRIICNFIAHNFWIIITTFYILTILTNTCDRVPTVISFALTILFTTKLSLFFLNYKLHYWICIYSHIKHVFVLLIVVINFNTITFAFLVILGTYIYLFIIYFYISLRWFSITSTKFKFK